MESFKSFFYEKIKKKEKKEKELLFHKVLIQVEEGNKVKGTKPKIIIKSALDTNLKGFVTYSTYEDAKITYDNLEDINTIVEYLQRNSTDSINAINWSYIVRDEVNKREEMKPTPPPPPKEEVLDEDDPESEDEEVIDSEEDISPEELKAQSEKEKSEDELEPDNQDKTPDSGEDIEDELSKGNDK